MARAARTALLVLGALVVPACDSGGPGLAPATPAPATSPSPAPAAATSVPRSVVDQARAQLVARFGYAPGEVRLVLVERVVWPSAALGCPRTGRTYAAAEVPGYRVLVARGALQHAFHGADGAAPVLCEFLD